MNYAACAAIFQGVTTAPPSVRELSPLSREGFEVFALDWGRWLNDAADCYPEGATCNSGESDYRSPQRWHPPEHTFYDDPNPHRAAVMERLVSSSLVNAVEAALLRTEHVKLPWWKLTTLSREELARIRMRYARTHGAGVGPGCIRTENDYRERLFVAEQRLCRALAVYAHLL